MKTGASILLFILSFSTIQPLLSVEKKSDTMKCCFMGKGGCSKKMPQKNPKNKCEGMGCNPFMGCPYYTMFLTTKTSLSAILPVSNEKIIVSNDNRTIQNISDFWHPPNASFSI